jgi:uncharacterized protein YdhG (YjbR/CyaY superfamily)
MPAKSAKAESDGFSVEERAAMKERAAELRAEGKKGAKNADGLQAVAEMAPEDRALAEARARDCDRDRPRLVAEDLVWHARLRERRRQGRRVLPGRGQVQLPLFTLGFQDAANLDDGDMWPVSYAVTKWSTVVEKKIAELVNAAIS